jgi:LysM repeat protein
MSVHTSSERLPAHRVRRVTGCDRRDARSRYSRNVAAHAVVEWAAVAVVGLTLLIAVASYAASGLPAEVATRPVKVEAGDTLWSIASAHPVAGLRTEETVDLIRRANGMDGSVVYVGQLIDVPHESASTPTLAQK